MSPIEAELRWLRLCTKQSAARGRRYLKWLARRAQRQATRAFLTREDWDAAIQVAQVASAWDWV